MFIHLWSWILKFQCGFWKQMNWRKKAIAKAPSGWKSSLKKNYSEVPSSDLAVVSIWEIKWAIFRCKSTGERIRTLTLTHPRVCSLPPSVFSGSVRFDQDLMPLQNAFMISLLISSSWWLLTISVLRSVVFCVLCPSTITKNVLKEWCLTCSLFDLIRIWCQFRRHLWFHC